MINAFACILANVTFNRATYKQRPDLSRGEEAPHNTDGDYRLDDLADYPIILGHGGIVRIQEWQIIVALMVQLCISPKA